MAKSPTRPRSRTYVVLDGQQDVREAFAKLKFGAVAGAREAISVSVDEIRDEGKARIAVSTPASRKAKDRPGPGQARDSIFARLLNFGLTGEAGSAFYTARFEEQGVDGRAARPWLNPAFQIVKPRFLDRLRKGLNVAVLTANKPGRRS